MRLLQLPGALVGLVVPLLVLVALVPPPLHLHSVLLVVRLVHLVVEEVHLVPRRPLLLSVVEVSAKLLREDPRVHLARLLQGVRLRLAVSVKLLPSPPVSEPEHSVVPQRLLPVVDLVASVPHHPLQLGAYPSELHLPLQRGDLEVLAVLQVVGTL